MPTLAWRSDVDGFAFANSWSFDAAERTALANLASAAAPAAVAAVSLLIPEPITATILAASLTAATQTYLVLGPSPAIGLCGGMAYTSLDYWRSRAPLPAARTAATSRPGPAPARPRCATGSGCD